MDELSVMFHVKVGTKEMPKPLLISALRVAGTSHSTSRLGEIPASSK